MSEFYEAVGIDGDRWGKTGPVDWSDEANEAFFRCIDEISRGGNLKVLLRSGGTYGHFPQNWKECILTAAAAGPHWGKSGPGTAYFKPLPWKEAEIIASLKADIEKLDAMIAKYVTPKRQATSGKHDPGY